MIVYVDIEHKRLQKNNPELWQLHLSQTLDIKYRLEELSGDVCLVVPYEKLTPQLLRELDVKAVLVSGNRTEFQHYDEAKLAGLRAVFREAAQPTIGFCGGAQMMAETFGSKAAAIDADESGNMDDESWQKRTHEYGFTRVRQVAEHPLLAGVGSDMVVMEAHYWEIKGLPDGFENFAETDITPLQLIAHKELPLFATQFHPEKWTETNRDGRKILENFFRLAGLVV
jgi:GMP synthase (glutamine-hydrolysing)